MTTSRGLFSGAIVLYFIIALEVLIMISPFATFFYDLYYLLARDEERRMVNQFSDRYREYMERTGMFFPRRLELAAGRLPLLKSAVLPPLTGFAVLAVVAVGSAFALRAFTVARLPLWS